MAEDKTVIAYNKIKDMEDYLKSDMFLEVTIVTKAPIKG